MAILTKNRNRYPAFRKNTWVPFLAVAALLMLGGGVGWHQPTPLVDQGPLGDPVGLTASSGPGVGQVSLRWTPAANATIHRVLSISIDGSDYRWHDAGHGEAVISSLQIGQEYHFTVVAGQVQPDGISVLWSGFSNWVTATAAITPALGDPMPVSAGYAHSCKLASDGTAVCWGGRGDVDRGQAKPPQGQFTAISAGGRHTCAIEADGTVACWGDDSDGQSTPPPREFKAIDAGRAHTCGIRTDGTVACWGSNEYQQLAVPAGMFTTISSGEEHVCGLRVTGAAECWGDNFYGQSVPSSGKFQSISAGFTHSCAVDLAGYVVCWGLGVAAQGPRSIWQSDLISVSTGRQHTCALRSGGDVVCWGRFSLDSREDSPGGTFQQISAGEAHTCGLLTDGNIVC